MKLMELLSEEAEQFSPLTLVRRAETVFVPEDRH